MLDHPGKDAGQPASRPVYEAAAAYLGRKQDLIPESITDYPGSFESQESFGRYTVEQVTRRLAYDAVENLQYLSGPANAILLSEKQKMLSEAFELDLEEYLDAIQLEWVIFPPGVQEGFGDLPGGS